MGRGLGLRREAPSTGEAYPSIRLCTALTTPRTCWPSQSLQATDLGVTLQTHQKELSSVVVGGWSVIPSPAGAFITTKSLTRANGPRHLITSDPLNWTIVPVLWTKAKFSYD